MPRVNPVIVIRRFRGKKCLERISAMPKIKTSKSAAKRFKVTGTGKILRRNARKGHLMISKCGSRKRRLSMDSVVSPSEVKKVRRMVPNLAQL